MILKKSLAGDLADDVALEVAKQPKEVADEDKTWSVVLMNDGYAAAVDHFSSKERAEREARDTGGRYVVRGTQMWNEPLGQVEEHDRVAPYKYFK